MRQILITASTAVFGITLLGGMMAPPMAKPEPVSETRTGYGVGAAAIVNDEVISTIDVRQRVALMVITTGTRPSSDDMLRQMEAAALRALIDERLQMQEAKRLKVEVKPEEVEAALQDLSRENKLPLAELDSQLRSVGGSINSLRDQIRAEIIWQRLIGARYGSRIRVSKEQIDETLKRMSASADKPQYLLSEIVLDTSTEAAPETVARRLMEELGKGVPFAALARQFSIASSAAAGGDVGWVSAGELAPEVEAAIAQLQPGQISLPITSADGVRIVALRERRTSDGARLIFGLKQAVVPVRGRADAPETIAALGKATATLNTLRGRITGCGDFDGKVKGVPGVSSGEIAKIDMGKLAMEFQRAVRDLQVGQVSAPVRTRIGVHILAVCSRETVTGVNLPDRKEIEYRLQNQQLSMLSKRYLRDLRSAATIEGR